MPTGSVRNAYAPFELVVSLNVALVATLMTVTSALATAPPEASVTVPIIVPVVSCAFIARNMLMSIAIRQKQLRERRIANSLLANRASWRSLERTVLTRSVTPTDSYKCCVELGLHCILHVGSLSTGLCDAQNDCGS